MISTPPEAANTQKAMVDKMEDKADDAREACKETVIPAFLIYVHGELER